MSLFFILFSLSVSQILSFTVVDIPKSFSTYGKTEANRRILQEYLIKSKFWEVSGDSDKKFFCVPKKDFQSPFFNFKKDSNIWIWITDTTFNEQNFFKIPERDDILLFLFDGILGIPHPLLYSSDVILQKAAGKPILIKIQKCHYFPEREHVQYESRLEILGNQITITIAESAKTPFRNGTKNTLSAFDRLFTEIQSNGMDSVLKNEGSIRYSTNCIDFISLKKESDFKITLSGWMNPGEPGSMEIVLSNPETKEILYNSYSHLRPSIVGWSSNAQELFYFSKDFAWKKHDATRKERISKQEISVTLRFFPEENKFPSRDLFTTNILMTPLPSR